MKETPRGPRRERHTKHRLPGATELRGINADSNVPADSPNPLYSTTHIDKIEKPRDMPEATGDVHVTPAPGDIVIFESRIVDGIPQQYEKSDIYSAVRMLHDARVTARAEDISLMGVGSKAKGKKEEANTILQIELDARPDLVDVQLEPYMPYLQGKGKKKETPEVVKEKVVKNYRDGLGTVINLLSKTSENDFDLHSAIIGYTASFKNMLKVCEQYNVHPNTAVFLARQSYNVTGPDLIRLFDQYEDIPQKVILSAAKYNPRNPEKFVKGFIDTVDQLSADERYAEVSPGVISRAAANNSKDPKGYLDKYIAARDRLSSKPEFASLLPNIIEIAAMGYPGNPEKYLRDYIKLAERVRKNEKYKDIPSRIIDRALRSSFQDPEGFLDEYATAIAELQADTRFQDLSPTVLVEAAATTDPEGFIVRYKKIIARLSADPKYRNLNPSDISQAAAFRPANPETYLDEQLEK